VAASPGAANIGHQWCNNQNICGVINRVALDLPRHMHVSQMCFIATVSNLLIGNPLTCFALLYLFNCASLLRPDAVNIRILLLHRMHSVT